MVKCSSTIQQKRTSLDEKLRCTFSRRRLEVGTIPAHLVGTFCAKPSDAEVVAAAGLIERGLLTTETDYDGLCYIVTAKGGERATEIRNAALLEREQLLARVVGSLLASVSQWPVRRIGAHVGTMLDAKSGTDKGVDALRLYLLIDGTLAEAKFNGLAGRDRFDDESKGAYEPPIHRLTAREAVEQYPLAILDGKGSRESCPSILPLKEFASVRHCWETR